MVRSLSDTPELHALAESVGTNSKRLNEAFRQCVGVTVFEYLREERMREACLLLSGTGLSIQDIAMEVGFTSGANFSTAFRDRYGLSPASIDWYAWTWSLVMRPDPRWFCLAFLVSLLILVVVGVSLFISSGHLQEPNVDLTSQAQVFEELPGSPMTPEQAWAYQGWLPASPDNLASHEESRPSGFGYLCVTHFPSPGTAG